MRSIADRPTRRAGHLGVHSLDRFALTVPDLDEAERFYTAFGLTVERWGGGLRLLTDTGPQAWALLMEGPRKALHHLSFGIFADDLPAFARRLDDACLARVAAPNGLDGGGLWFRDTDDRLVELRPAEKTAPDEPSLAVAGPAAAPTRGLAPRTRPRRLAHVALFTPDVGRTVAFCQSVLGLRLSDRSGDLVAFLHGAHGSEHHMVAFAASEAPGFHHCSWDVPSIDAIGLGAQRMAEQGYAAGWGLGRHTLGSNYFHYVRDPWGSWSEYSCGMDYVPADLDWTAADHPPEDALSLWGPAPPADFVRNTEAAAHG